MLLSTGGFIIMETILKLNYTNKVGGCSTHVQMNVSYLLLCRYLSIEVHVILLPWPAESQAAALSDSPQRPQISTG